MAADKKLRWGLLAAGHIAEEFADGVIGSTTGGLLAVGSRAQKSADEFAARYGIPRAYGSYEALLADPDVDAVYISTPHPMHAEWVIKAAEAGKHILCEKPIGINVSEALAMIDAAREHDVFLMEAFMYRCHPQMHKVVEMIREGVLGEVRLIEASFAYQTDFDSNKRHFAQHLGGGGILDVGCYPASVSRLIAGAVQGKPFAEPVSVKGVGHLGATGTDDWAIASVLFENDLVASLSTGVRLNKHEENHVKIYGSEGKLLIPVPWIPSRFDRDPAKLILRRSGASEPEEILVEAPLDLYTYEADMVANHIADRQAPAMSWDDTLGNMRLLDAWRAEVGLVYDLEKPPTASANTIAGRPLAVRERRMKYGTVAGVDKPVSRLVMGADSNQTYADTAMLFDAYFEYGGNTFDTSYGYGNPNGACERNLGAWVAKRGIRDQVVVIEKGANEPNDTPAGLTRELLGGLDRLGIDYADIYMIHRDNQEVPIGEWVDVLNENLHAGRMRIFGLSNFSIPRLIAFSEYAAKNGLQSFSVVSNQLSLARMLDPIWNAYLVSSSDPESRAYFERTQTPVFSWSSQARGFFTARAAPDKRDNAELVRCWYSEENFARKRRAEELARKRGVEPINIALAWVLNQPFPTFPLFGPKRPAELRSSLGALEIDLTPEEIAWLDGE